MKLVSMVKVVFVAVVMSWGAASAQFGLGADVVSRYVWRGTDFGNAASVQPYISYTAGILEVGAWGSYSIMPVDGGYENDLYVTLSQGPVSITVTDYYFPNMEAGMDEFFKYGEDDNGASYHFIEASGTFTQGPLSLLAGVFLTNDDDNSLYFEGAYEAYAKDDVTASVFVGGGNGAYTLEDAGDDDSFNVVNVGLTVAKDMFSASYILNPDAKITFIGFGVSF